MLSSTGGRGGGNLFQHFRQARPRGLGGGDVLERTNPSLSIPEMLDVENPGGREQRAPVPITDLDLALTAQIVVAWAGESGEEPRLGWWRSDLISEFGGKDLFRRLLPGTWAWAILQGAREAARRQEVEMRRQDHDPDRIVSLYGFGSELDERIEERLMDLKRSGREPEQALPGLVLLEEPWNKSGFADWIDGHGTVPTMSVPLGRWIKGEVPEGLDQQVRRLVAGLAPVSDRYPWPHFRRTR